VSEHLRNFVSRRHTSTISLRLAIANAGVLLCIVVALVAFSVYWEKRSVVRVERETAIVLLDHLASMLNPASDPDEVCRLLASVGSGTERSGLIHLVAPDADAPRGYYLAAYRDVTLGSGRQRLAYYASLQRTRSMARTNLLAHVAAGLVALAGLLWTTEIIVRRRLTIPLRAFVHQIRHASRGGGWAMDVPEVDSELDELRESFREFGPSLDGQMAEWIAVERRAAAAMASNRIRLALSDEFQGPNEHKGSSDDELTFARIDRVLAACDDAEWAPYTPCSGAPFHQETTNGD